MNAPTRGGSGTDSGITSPPLPPDLLSTAEGPMRRELLRQIAHLEEQISRFVHENCPMEPLPSVTRRGPAILPTADLERIRDELLATRTEMHNRVVARVTERMGLDRQPKRGLGARLRDRLSRGSEEDH